MCAYHAKGRCMRGAACSYAHDPSELRLYQLPHRHAAAEHASSPPQQVRSRSLAPCKPVGRQPILQKGSLLRPKTEYFLILREDGLTL
jgi:hypothetical protein